MALMSARFSYQKLKHEASSASFDEKHYDDLYYNNLKERVIRRERKSRLRKVHIRKKLRIKIPSLRRFFKRKTRLIKVACRKVLKRLKESQAHFGDLFAGNYVFMQVTPTPVTYGDKKFKYHHHHHHHDVLHTLSSSRYSLPRVV